MGFIIDDGSGKGFSARVNSDGHLVIDAITLEEITHVSDEHGLAFSWSSGTYAPSATGDTILLIKNTSTTRALFIKDVYLSTAAETRVIIHLPTVEVTPTGTAITGTNLNTLSSNVAETTAIRDETDNSIGGIIWSGEIPIVGTPYKVPFDGAVILGQNKSIAVDYVADPGTVCDVTITGWFE